MITLCKSFLVIKMYQPKRKTKELLSPLINDVHKMKILIQNCSSEILGNLEFILDINVQATCLSDI